MPTYEYRCKDCGHDFEAQQSFQDDPIKECPSCGGVVRKVFGRVGITFRGSGFYKNDSRPKSGSNGETTKAKDSEGSSTPSGSGEGSSSSGDSSSSKSDTKTSSSESSKADTKKPSTSTAKTGS